MEGKNRYHYLARQPNGSLNRITPQKIYIYLYNSKKSSTFVPKFEYYARRTVFTVIER